MPQDFSRKMVIVVREDVSSWVLTNTVGHIAAYLGNKMSVPFDTGDHFSSQDGHNFPRNSQFPIIVLKANPEEIKVLARTVQKSSLPRILYTQEMVDMIDDNELSTAFNKIPFENMNILGIGIFGLKDELKSLTNGLKLWK